MRRLKINKNAIRRTLGIGKKRIKINPEKLEDVSKAITRADIRDLVKKKTIKIEKKKGVSRARAKKRKEQRKKGRRRGHGRRKGAKGARVKPEKVWVSKVRAQRRLLKEYKNKLNSKTYREIYLKIKGNYFRSKAHLKMHIEKVLKE